MKRKICIVTGTRAEYGLLRWVMDGITKSSELHLQIIATGSHLSPEFGLTYREIEGDGFSIDRKVEIVLSSDTPVGVAKSMGLGLIGFADAFQELKPDMVMVLGDRYELLAASSAALVCRIPIGHIHGGETTEGAFDEAIRHSITKMSHIHFVAADEYRRRVIQLGESPSTVHLVGGLGLDSIAKLPLLDRSALESALEFSLGERSLIVTFHPVTLENASSEEQMNELLASLDAHPEINYIFTMPNADNDSRVIFKLIRDFVSSHKNAVAFNSLGQLKYLSCLKHVDGAIGNSSSGIIEVPAFFKGTINIGDRQKGRLRAASVIDCEPDRRSISQAMETLYSREFQQKLAHVANPYGKPGASDRIVAILEAQQSTHLKKKFHDLPAALIS